MTISNESRGRIKKVFEPIALAMGRVGLTPNGLTLIGFGISIAGALLLVAQLWVIGGIVVFVGGAFDMFDGTLARATGKVSPFGAFMDSVFDRWGEAVVYLGIAWGAVLADADTVAILATAALGAAFMVSYTRAKSEGLGFSPGIGMAAIGVMPREIRRIVLSLGLIVAGATANLTILSAALAIIAIGAVITIIQRILQTRSQAKSADTTTNH
jgi:CDP-diacylglycerol--glycerol-3-phosphate 3-phosphatidyltransferase